MDILRRKQLNSGDHCYFFVSSFEDPYIYLKMIGTVVEIHTVYEDQTIYRIKALQFLDNEEHVRSYMNRNSYKVYDIKNEINKTKRFYTFDSPDLNKFIQTTLDGYLFEVSSAVTFADQAEMNKTFLQVNEYIVKKLQATIETIGRVCSMT